MFVPFTVVLLALAFYYLSFVAEEHLGPTLHHISKAFKLSSSLGGVTLMAFGGGAPDVLSSLSASSTADTSGIQMGISVLIGSSFFTLAIVSGIVVLAAPNPIVVNKQIFFRDCMALGSSYLLLAYTVAVKQ